VRGNAEPEDLSPAVPHDQQAIKERNETVGTTNKSIGVSALIVVSR
jgi:hypothetical protein